jgi:hypothetical protein
MGDGPTPAPQPAGRNCHAPKLVPVRYRRQRYVNSANRFRCQGRADSAMRVTSATWRGISAWSARIVPLTAHVRKVHTSTKYDLFVVYGD